MSLLSEEQAKFFSRSLTKSMNDNIKCAVNKRNDEMVLFKDNDWTMTDNQRDNKASNDLCGARLWHQCDKHRERYQSPYDTIKGKCWSCNAKVPEAIRTLWTLYNADNMHQWLDGNTFSDGTWR